MYRLSPRSAHRREAGFSLVELIVVVAILGILILVAIPVYGAVQNNAEKQTTQQAANNTFTSLSALYAQGKGSEGAAFLETLNKQDPSITYAAQNNARDYFKKLGEPLAIRYNLESGFATNPMGYTKAALRAALPVVGELKNAQQQEADGTFLCVMAFSGTTTIKHMAFAGPGCGMAYTPGGPAPTVEK